MLLGVYGALGSCGLFREFEVGVIYTKDYFQALCL